MGISELTEKLNKLLISEYEAIYWYYITSRFVSGRSFDTIVSHFEEHINDEKDHADKLISTMQESGIEVITVPSDIVKKFVKTDLSIKDFSVDRLIDLNKELEDIAIKDYTELYKSIESEYLTIADNILEILQDEKEHQLDLVKLLGSSSSNQPLVNNNSEFAIDMKKHKLQDEARNSWMAVAKKAVNKDNVIIKMYESVDNSDREKFIDICKKYIEISPSEIDDEVSELSSDKYTEFITDLLKLNYKKSGEIVKNFSESFTREYLLQYADMLATKFYGDDKDYELVEELVDNCIEDSNGDLKKAKEMIEKSYHD